MVAARRRRGRWTAGDAMGASDGDDLLAGRRWRCWAARQLAVKAKMGGDGSLRRWRWWRSASRVALGDHGDHLWRRFHSNEREGESSERESGRYRDRGL